MKLIRILYYLFVYICLLIISSLGYSFFSKQFFYSSLFSIPYLVLFGMITIFIYIAYRYTKRIDAKKYILLFILVGMSVCSVFVYFPFMHLGKVPIVEKFFVERYLVKPNVKSNRLGDWAGDIIVAHSLGAIDNHKVTPCIEAFETNYRNGFRSFEVDFVPTSDHYLVCRHLWENPDLQKGIDENHIPTLKEFKKTKILDQYTPMTFKDLCMLMMEYKDAWIVTDSKETSTEEVIERYTEIVKEASEVDALEVLDRFAIQAYDKEMVKAVREIYPFKNIIYATYRDWHGDIISFVDICNFCNENGINSISMWNYYYCDELQDIANYYDIDIYIHTENDLASANRYLRMGAKGIYTDFILPPKLYVLRYSGN